MTKKELRQIALDVCTPEQIAYLDADDATRPHPLLIAWFRDIGRTLVCLAVLLLLILWRVW